MSQEGRRYPSLGCNRSVSYHCNRGPSPKAGLGGLQGYKVRARRGCHSTYSCRTHPGADPQTLLTGPPSGTNPQRPWDTLLFSPEHPAWPSPAPYPRKTPKGAERAEGSERACLPCPGVPPIFRAWIGYPGSATIPEPPSAAPQAPTDGRAALPRLGLAESVEQLIT